MIVRRVAFIAAALLAIGLVTGLGQTASASASRPAPSTSAARSHYTPAACAYAVSPTSARCAAQVWTAGSGHRIVPDAAGPPADALGPSQIQDAYELPSGGGGQTVAIVDAHGDSAAESDLAHFRSQYGLPPCTTANGCFRKVDQNGGTHYPADDAGWALETSLDVDAVSSACPACNILLVEGDDESTDSLGTAVDTAIGLGAKFVSNSYGVPGEFDGETDDDSYYSHKGVVVVASTGDTGNVVNWPASDPDVVAAGGTTLDHTGGAGRGWDETAWTDGGSGCSQYEPRPDYQLTIDTDCPHNRAIADISADADPASGLAVYDTLGENGWLRVGGTSLSSPLIASMYALAGTPAPDTFPVAALYDQGRASQFFDITSGSDGGCGDVLCTAGPGWDGPTGVGTPDGVAGLSAGPHGDILGRVTDRKSGDPVAGALIETSSGAATTSDPDGRYELSGLSVGDYTVTATAYRYAKLRTTDVQVAKGRQTKLSFALMPVPSATVSGRVTDASGQHWPLYAEIQIDGYPKGPIFTDPRTGRYSVELPQSNSYVAHVEPFYGGYTAKTKTIDVGTTAAATANVAVAVDEAACDAPGYGPDGSSTDFSGWTGGAAKDGWTSTGTPGWRFDNPGQRQVPPNGDDHFAVADAAYYGSAMHTTLTSPTVGLVGRTKPVLSFDTRYLGAPHQSGAAQVSTDHGRTWTTVWSRTTSVVSGAVRVPLELGSAPSVQVRFRFSGDAAGLWELDNVFVGSPTCTAQHGGLVVGTVRDAASGKPLPGAKVYDPTDRADAATAVATVDDPDVADAFYWLFVPSGKRTLVADAAGHARSRAVVTVASDAVTRYDWALARG